MSITRPVLIALLGSLLMSSAFAASHHSKPHAHRFLSKEQISNIHKECSKENSMTSKAYHTCVRAKEKTAIAESRSAKHK